MISAEPGLRIIFIELIHGFLSAISITILKDAEGPFTRTIYCQEMSAAAFIPPIEEFPGKSIPLEFDPVNYHFYLQQTKKQAQRYDLSFNHPSFC